MGPEMGPEMAAQRRLEAFMRYSMVAGYAVPHA
jgi:hypothetical protein